MTKRKSVEAFACVGSHGKPFASMVSSNPQIQGRFEIFLTQKDAEGMALSPAHVRRVRIILGDYTQPQVVKPGRS